MQRSALCRSRRELSNAYLLAKIRFDTAENEPSKACPIESSGRGARTPSLINAFFPPNVVIDQNVAERCKFLLHFSFPARREKFRQIPGNSEGSAPSPDCVAWSSPDGVGVRGDRERVQRTCVHAGQYRYTKHCYFRVCLLIS